MDKDVLIHQMTERFQALYGRALGALEQAPDGQWITASEFAFRDAFQELMKECYQEAIQGKIDAHPTARQAAFSPSGPRGGEGSGPAEQGRAEGGRSDGSR